MKLSLSKESVVSGTLEMWLTIVGFVIMGTLFYADAGNTKDRVTVIEVERKGDVKLLNRIDRRLYRIEIEQGIKEVEPTTVDESN